MVIAIHRMQPIAAPYIEEVNLWDLDIVQKGKDARMVLICRKPGFARRVCYRDSDAAEKGNAKDE